MNIRLVILLCTLLRAAALADALGHGSGVNWLALPVVKLHSHYMDAGFWTLNALNAVADNECVSGLDNSLSDQIALVSSLNCPNDSKERSVRRLRTFCASLLTSSRSNVWAYPTGKHVMWVTVPVLTLYFFFNMVRCALSAVLEKTDLVIGGQSSRSCMAWTTSSRVTLSFGTSYLLRRVASSR